MDSYNINHNASWGNLRVAKALMEWTLHDPAGWPTEGSAMGKLNGIELKRARLVPSSVFTSPEAVVRSTDLSRTQKIQILRRWEFDCSRSPSDERTACLGDFTGMLSQVRGALASLGALSLSPRGSDVRH